ncbi:NAD(P)/FAD-dependent oxidoreductase [Candidatus Acetatifactor stercoripullorum]|nr:NAD(P)/FAD-dependent oxidoreductase [Candidatus Acetatifactor stercoripullorum]
MERYDIIIIGAGVSGCAAARELSRDNRRIAVLERASDVCEGTSKANSGIVHAGFDAPSGTLKARLNVWGSERMEALSKELDFPFRRNGSLVLCFHKEELGGLRELLERGEKNGVKGLQILTPAQVWEREPGISRKIAGALYAPSGGIVCPFGLNIALAENAAENGVDFYFSHEVTRIARRQYLGPKQPAEAFVYEISAGSRTFAAPVVVNAAGVYADVLHNMVSEYKLKIVPRRGEYCLFDKKSGSLVQSTVFQLPSKMGKGILVTPTVHGNLLVGPNAEDIPDKEGTNTTAPGIKQVLEKGKASVESLDEKQVITSFAGLRAHLEEGGREGDFVIGQVQDAPGFYDVAGIESPGLSCAPAIGEYVAQLIREAYPAKPKKNFNPFRKGIPSMAEASDSQRKALIERDPSYANVICRCELVTEGEIRDAIRRPLGARTLDGVKRRTRAGMGRCQSGFCSPKVLEILTEELKEDASLIRKAQPGSEILIGYNKDSFWEEAKGGMA